MNGSDCCRDDAQPGHPVKAELHAQCCEDVKARLEHPDFAGHKVGAGINPISAAIVERVVSAGIDTAIAYLGAAGKVVVEQAKPYIRKVVSEQAVEYLDALIEELKDAPAAA